jgi:predicted small secreted protein
MKLFFYSILLFAVLSFVFVSCKNTIVGTGDITVQISDSLIIHAYITDYYWNTNFKNDDDFAAVAWISGPTGYVGRTLFKFNLSSIPSNATIKKAIFLLNYNVEPFHYSGAGHHQDSGSNASYFQRITQNWLDSVVTWGNQPTVTTNGQIILDSSNSNYQNYSVDMTAAINDMVKNPASNFGFLFKLKYESPIRVLGFTFGSGNHNLKPVLNITFSNQNN